MGNSKARTTELVRPLFVGAPRGRPGKGGAHRRRRSKQRHAARWRGDPREMVLEHRTVTGAPQMARPRAQRERLMPSGEQGIGGVERCPPDPAPAPTVRNVARETAIAMLEH